MKTDHAHEPADQDPPDFDEQQPGVILPDERLATFFFRMPTSIGWPVNQAIRMTDAVHIGFHSFLEELVGAHVAMHSPRILTASVLFHEVEEDVSETSFLSSIMRAFDVGFPLQGADSTGPGPRSTPPPRGKAHVAEVVVPLGATFALTAFGKAERDSELPDLEDPPDDLLSAALDTALRAVRSLQSAYVASTRRTTRILTRQQLPAFVPVGLRAANRTPVEDGSIRMIFANDRFERFGIGETLTEAQQASMFKTQNQPDRIRAYTDLYNQALVALNLDGNCREAAVMVGAASEAFLNLLILCLRWETGMTPEISALAWPDSFATRISTNLPPVLGGNWSPRGEAPYGRWRRHTYELRNRVAHGGYEPSTHECELAIKSLDALIAEIAMRLTSGARLKAYPRVASMLFGSRLQPRLPRLPWLSRLQDDPHEVNWIVTSGRWIETHYRLTHDEVEPRVPDASRAELISTWNPKEPTPTSWMLIDTLTGLGAEVSVATDKVSMPAEGSSFPSDIEFDEGIPALVGHHRQPDDVQSVGPWVEAYHLNSMLGVMVDGTDLEQAWPLKRE